MLRTFIVLILAAIPLLVFLGYCRSLLSQTSAIELTETGMKSLAMHYRTMSLQNFRNLQSLARLCPIGEKDSHALTAVSMYYFLLAAACAICSRFSESLGDWTKRERRRCCYAVAVMVDRRIANAVKLWASVHIDDRFESL